MLLLRMPAPRAVGCPSLVGEQNLTFTAWVPQIVVLESAEARAQAAAAAASESEQAAQRQQHLSVAVARKEAALQEAQQTIARLQRWGPDVAV